MSEAPAPRRSVRRRILLLFVLCGLLPVTAAIVVSYQRVGNELLTQRAALLRGAASNLAAILVERLNVAEQLAHAAAADGGAALAGRRDATQRFVRAAVEFDSGRFRVLFGRPARLPSSAGRPRSWRGRSGRSPAPGWSAKRSPSPSMCARRPASCPASEPPAG